LALPRGGVVTGYQIAEELHLPLDIFVVRKIGAPQNEELAVGALSQDGNLQLDRRLMEYLSITEEDLRKTIDHERLEAARRLKVYRSGRSPISLEGKTVILCDDGIATGSTAKVAIHGIRTHNPKQIILAVPVMPIKGFEEFSKIVDDVVYLETPKNFHAVGQFYQRFDQTQDKEVLELLQKNWEQQQPEPK